MANVPGPVIPERYGAMSGELLAQDEAFLAGGSGATPTTVPEGQDIPDSDNAHSQEYFTAVTYDYHDTPGWIS